MNGTKDHRVLFLRQFLKHPRQIGSITPSSRFLERRIVALADIPAARTIVELGAGTGGTTRAMLKAMPADARLLVIELNPHFCDLLKHIDDRRLIVQRGSADELREALARHRLAAPDAVVSGIPFSTIGPAAGTRIIETISELLNPGGRFVAYQVRNQVDALSRRILGIPHVEVELLNVPPVRLYRWQKAARPASPTVERRNAEPAVAKAR